MGHIYIVHYLFCYLDKIILLWSCCTSNNYVQMTTMTTVIVLIEHINILLLKAIISYIYLNIYNFSFYDISMYPNSNSSLRNKYFIMIFLFWCTSIDQWNTGLLYQRTQVQTQQKHKNIWLTYLHVWCQMWGIRQWSPLIWFALACFALLLRQSTPCFKCLHLFFFVFIKL